MNRANTTNRRRGKRNSDGAHGISTVRAKCMVMIPGNPLPTRCDDRAFKAGRCAEHFRDMRNARDARRIGAKTEPVVISRIGVKTSTWIPKADRKWTKDPIHLLPEPKHVAA